MIPHLRVAFLRSFVGASLLLGTPSSALEMPRASARYFGLVAHADSLVAQRRVAAAERYLDSLVTTARAGGNRDLEMVAVLRRAGSWLFTRSAAAASAEAERGIALARAAGDTLAWCRGLMVVQYAAFDAVRIKQGEATARNLIALARRSRDREAEAVGRIGLGYAALEQKAFAKSATQYRQAIALAEAAAITRQELRARIGLARALFGLRDLDGCRAANRQAIALAQKVGDPLAEADAWNNLGVAEHQVGDPSLAPSYYSAAVKLRRQFGIRTSASVTNLALTQVQLGRYADAATALLADRPALERNGTLGDRVLHARTLAEVRLSQRRLSEAESLFTWSWRVSDSLRSAMLAIPAGLGLMRYLVTTQEPPRAIAFGAQLLERYGTQLSLDDRIGASGLLGQAMVNGNQHAAAVQLLLPLAAVADSAQPIMSQRRSTLEFLLAAALLPSSPAKSRTHIARAAAHWEATRSALRNPEYREAQNIPSQLAALTVQSWLNDPRAGLLAERTTRAFESVQRYKGRTLLERGSSARAIERAHGTWSFSLAVFQRTALRRGEVLLDYHMDRRAGYLFVVTPTRVSVHPLPGNDSLRVQVGRLRDLLQDSRSSPALRAAAGRDLSRCLLGPATAELSAAERVLVSPAASLGSVPFAALAGPSGEPLAQTHEIVNVPSAAWLMEERRRPAPGRAQLAVAARTTDAGGRSLEGVANEARWLDHQFAGVSMRVHAGDQTVEQVLAGMRKGQVLHVASHAQANAENPWDSAMLLGRGEGDDAWLTADRIARERLGARLTVIAGCNSDVRSPMMTENVNGLSSAFLAAGASAVVATLWAVDDRVTQKWTQLFYGELARGATVATAARKSQAALRADPTTAHPVFWAGFVTVGDPSLRVKLAPRFSLLPGPLR